MGPRLTPEQIRAARAMLNWSQAHLSDLVGMSKTSIVNIKAGRNSLGESNMLMLLDIFESAGLEFISGGVRWREEEINVLKGLEGIRKFLQLVYRTASTEGGSFLVYGVDEELFSKASNAAGIRDWYREKMKHIDNLSFKVIIKESDPNSFAADHCEYRRMPDDYIVDVAPFYVMGDYLVHIIFHSEPRFYLIKSQDLVKSYSALFEYLWTNSRKL